MAKGRSSREEGEGGYLEFNFSVVEEEEEKKEQQMSQLVIIPLLRIFLLDYLSSSSSFSFRTIPVGLEIPLKPTLSVPSTPD